MRKTGIRAQAIFGRAARIIALAALTLASASLGAQSASGTTPAAGEGGALSISVLYFDNTAKSADYEWLSKGIADMTATDLASSPHAVIVERERLEKVLKELELGLSGLADPESAPELGKLLSAELLVYGSFIISGNALRLDAKAVRAQTGATIAAAQASGSTADIFAAQAELSARLAAALGLELARAPEPVSTEAAKAYYQGLTLFDQGKYAEALALFDDARKLDPGFAKPGASIEEAYKYLKDFKRQRYRREMNGIRDDIERLAARLSAKTFYSFADALQAPGRFGFKDAAAVSAAFQAHPRAWAGETPVQAAWELEHLYLELADLGMEYFEDEALREYCFDRILEISAAAERAYPKDPFLPEALYMRLFVYRERAQWDALRDLGERLMGDYPDYRMMYAVEDFYEDALEGLGLAIPEDED